MSLFKKMKIMVGATLRGDKMMTCGEALEELFEFLDGELDEPTRRRVKDHLALCAPCSTRADFEKAFLNAVASARDAGEPVSEKTRSRILAALDEVDDEPDQPF